MNIMFLFKQKFINGVTERKGLIGLSYRWSFLFVLLKMRKTNFVDYYSFIIHYLSWFKGIGNANT